jgi:hypothetical protein
LKLALKQLLPHFEVFSPEGFYCKKTGYVLKDLEITEVIAFYQKKEWFF